MGSNYRLWVIMFMLCARTSEPNGPVHGVRCLYNVPLLAAGINRRYYRVGTE
jgi:hypothetical protein